MITLSEFKEADTQEEEMLAAISAEKFKFWDSIAIEISAPTPPPPLNYCRDLSNVTC